MKKKKKKNKQSICCCGSISNVDISCSDQPVVNKSIPELIQIAKSNMYMRSDMDKRIIKMKGEDYSLKDLDQLINN